MIRYDMICTQGHRFDGWFQSAAGFDSLQAAGHLSCAVCGASGVDKALMAPALMVPVTRAPGPADMQKPDIKTPRDAREAALAALRAKVEAGSDYVGMNFAAEARAIHAGDAPERSIYGEARADEARALIEDGVPVAPLPFLPTRKAH